MEVFWRKEDFLEFNLKPFLIMICTLNWEGMRTRWLFNWQKGFKMPAICSVIRSNPTRFFQYSQPRFWNLCGTSLSGHLIPLCRTEWCVFVCVLPGPLHRKISIFSFPQYITGKHELRKNSQSGLNLLIIISYDLARKQERVTILSLFLYLFPRPIRNEPVPVEIKGVQMDALSIFLPRPLEISTILL